MDSNYLIYMAECSLVFPGDLGLTEHGSVDQALIPYPRVLVTTPRLPLCSGIHGLQSLCQIERIDPDIIYIDREFLIL